MSILPFRLDQYAEARIKDLSSLIGKTEIEQRELRNVISSLEDLIDRLKRQMPLPNAEKAKRTEGLKRWRETKKQAGADAK